MTYGYQNRESQNNTTNKSTPPPPNEDTNISIPAALKKLSWHLPSSHGICRAVVLPMPACMGWAGAHCLVTCGSNFFLPIQIFRPFLSFLPFQKLQLSDKLSIKLISWKMPDSGEDTPWMGLAVPKPYWKQGLLWDGVSGLPGRGWISPACCPWSQSSRETARWPHW